MDTPIITAAIAYAARGWRVLPVSTLKRPVLRDWPNAATTDPERIRLWWRASYRACQVGIACGSTSGIIVIDVDPRHGGDESLITLQRHHGGLPQTYEVRTPSGGRHLYFVCPASVEVRNHNGLGGLPGVDIRGEGGQVVAPPSRTEGGDYIIVREGEPAELPAAWIELLGDQSIPAAAAAPAPAATPHNHQFCGPSLAVDFGAGLTITAIA